jgi:multicomponent K+:H+ antiporter subunit D
MQASAPWHWLAAPVLLPLVASFVAVLLHRRPPRWRRAVSAVAAVALLGVAARLVAVAGDGSYTVYRMGDWPVPVAIVLVLDRLSALMVLLTAVVAAASAAHAALRGDEEGPHFHALFQLQLAGLNGAFLTGDLFNLFVFFEILLIASYCLLVHGATAARLRSGVHYVMLNLVGSSLFLVGIGVLYGLTGTLNLADLAARVARLGPADAGLVRSAGLLLFVVFALKAALAPLHFWLPNAYAAAAPPVAALFALMTKVGVYAILRFATLVYGPGAGVAAGTLEPWVLPVALATIVLGTLGALGAGELRRMQGYLLIASVGTMLAAVGAFTAGGVAAGLYYLVHSTLATAAMFLVAGLVEDGRGGSADLGARGPRVARPRAVGALFLVGAVALAGVPPLSGFVGKVLVLRAAPGGGAGVWLWALVLGSSVVAVVALTRAGVALFWAAPPVPLGVAPGPDGSPPGSTAPAAGLLAVIVLLTVLSGPVTGYVQHAAEQLLRPDAYVRAVLGTPGGR